MDKLDRIYLLHRIFSHRRSPISRADLEEQLGCSRATLTRLIRTYRDYLHAPLTWDAESGGYILERYQNKHYELPGLWLNASEICSLLTAHQLLSDVKPGILTPYITPLKDKLESLLSQRQSGNNGLFKRIRFLPMAGREPRLEEFQQAAEALISRKRLRIKYRDRQKDELSERWISPQRLVYYRDNWYLDAWCHMREELRTFSLDRLNISQLADQAIDIPDQQLDDSLTPTYGIFAGPVTNKAIIRFSPVAARWVADELWHPAQESQVLADGSLELTIPYGDPAELVQDILKYAQHAEVLAPETLRTLLIDRLSQALQQYKTWLPTD